MIEDQRSKTEGIYQRSSGSCPRQPRGLNAAMEPMLPGPICMKLDGAACSRRPAAMGQRLRSNPWGGHRTGATSLWPNLWTVRSGHHQLAGS